MARILLAMLVFGGVLVFLGVQEMRLAKAAKPEPQTISAADLIKSGPGDNAHVALKDYLMIQGAYVVETDKKGGTWKSVWFPVVSVDSPYFEKLMGMLNEDGTLSGTPPVPDDIRLIVKSKQVSGEADLSALANQESLQGMVINRIESLGSKQKQILQESYPKVNFDNVLILEHGRTPASAGKSFGFIGGGAALSCVGVLGMVMRRK